MILNKLNINGFGKFNNEVVEFSNGLNVVYGKNEAGKSTIMNLIKCMLYGTGKRGRSVKENIKTKYIPWNGTDYSASLNFENNGVNYTIIRDFNKPKNVSFLNDITGKPVEYNFEPGNYLFDISEEGFINTLCVSQLASAVYSDDTVLRKLSNINTSGNEDVSFIRVSSAIDEFKKLFVHKKGNGGILNENIRLLDELMQKRTAIVNELEKLSSLESELKNKLAEKNDIENCLIKLYNIKDIFDKNTLYRNINKVKDLTEEIDTLKQKLLEQIKTCEEISASDEQIKIKEEIKNIDEYILKHSVFEESDPETVQMFLKAEGVINEKNIKPPKFVFWFVIFAILSVLFLFIDLKYSKLASLLFGILCFADVTKILSKRKSYNNKLKYINSYKNEYINLCNKFGVENFNEYKENLNKYNELKTKKDKLSLELSSIELKNLKENKDAEVFKATALKTIAVNESLINDILKGKTLKQLTDDLGDYVPNDEEQMNICSVEDDINQAVLLKNKIISKITEITNDIKHIRYDAESLINIDEQILNCKQLIKKHKKICAACDLALDILTKSFEEIQSIFGKNLTDSVGNKLDFLTDGKYSKIYIDENFNIKLYDKSSDSIREIDYYSNGMADLIYFSFRLSLAEILFKDLSHIPLLLDDTFVQLDDSKIEKCVELLSKMSDKFQVIYFTCRTRELNLFKGYNISLINI